MMLADLLLSKGQQNVVFEAFDGGLVLLDFHFVPSWTGALSFAIAFGILVGHVSKE